MLKGAGLSYLLAFWGCDSDPNWASRTSHIHPAWPGLETQDSPFLLLSEKSLEGSQNSSDVFENGAACLP